VDGPWTRTKKTKNELNRDGDGDDLKDYYYYYLIEN